MLVSMLSTIDNPHDPFDNFKEWFAWDESHGYHTTGLLGRLTFTTFELSEEDQRLAVESAIDEIVRENITGQFIKLTREVPEE